MSMIHWQYRDIRGRKLSWAKYMLVISLDSASSSDGNYLT